MVDAWVKFQMFLRDAKQAEVLLNQQETFLSKEDVPVSEFSYCYHNVALTNTLTHWYVDWKKNLKLSLILTFEVLVLWNTLCCNFQIGRYSKSLLGILFLKKEKCIYKKCPWPVGDWTSPSFVQSGLILDGHKV